MKVVAVLSDLMLFSRIEAAARVTGADLARVDRPSDTPAGAELILVDWTARQPSWADDLRGIRGARVIVFGPHTDLDAHAAARAAGVGPMWARSRLLRELPSLLEIG